MKTKLLNLIDNISQRGEMVVQDQAHFACIYDVNIDDVFETSFNELHLELQEFVRENIVPLFIRFLKEKKVYGMYMDNNQGEAGYGWRRFPEMPIKDYVCDAFNWNNDDNWAKLDTEWGHFIVDLFDCDFIFDED